MNNHYKDEEINILDKQIILSFISIMAVIISISLTYSQKLILDGKKGLYTKEQFQIILLINKVIILVTFGLFLILNYKMYDIASKEGRNTKPFTWQLYGSWLAFLASLIALYVVISTPSDIADIENPTF